MSRPALTQPLAAIAQEQPSVRPSAAPASAVDPLGAASVGEFGLPICPEMHFTAADKWEVDPKTKALVIGDTVNHLVSLDLATGVLWAVPIRPHLTVTLFVNSSLSKFIDVIWRWASLQPVLDALSHTIESFDVTEDFLSFVNRNDPAPAGTESLWASWADTA